MVKDSNPSPSTPLSLSSTLSSIRNKHRRSRLRRRRRHRQASSTPRQPLTLDDKREYDSQTGYPLSPESKQNILDEFTPYLNGEKTPSIAITTSLHPTAVSQGFIRELLPILPNSVYYDRSSSSIREVLQWATTGNFTDVLIVQEDHRELTALLHGHLPHGPTCFYKLSSFTRVKDVPDHGRATKHIPEVVCTSFATSLGVRVSRMLSSLFPAKGDFMGRQVITFHNQRDFIFFRFHRYVFNAKKQGARLQELGPRFTLKLRAIQSGLFQHPDTAEYEWKWRAKNEVNRRRFFL